MDYTLFSIYSNKVIYMFHILWHLLFQSFQCHFLKLLEDSQSDLSVFLLVLDFAMVAPLNVLKCHQEKQRACLVFQKSLLG